jgi:hypothetical protein
MGFFSGLAGLAGSAISAVGSIFGGGGSSLSHNSSSTSNTQTMYEPDKVKVAELENNRMDKAIVAQKEIMKMNSEMQLMIMEAHQKGFEKSTIILKDMMKSLNLIAQERLSLIENGHFEIVEKIEKLYIGLEQEIKDDNDGFNMEQLPKMLEMLSKFEADSPSAKLYEKSIDKQIELNGTFFTQKLGALHERQKLMVTSAIKSKEQVLEQSSQIVLDRMKFLDKQLEYQQNIQFIPNQAQPQQINLTSNNEAVETKLIEE